MMSSGRFGHNQLDPSVGLKFLHHSRRSGSGLTVSESHVIR
jgi:hypothetical protein